MPKYFLFGNKAVDHYHNGDFSDIELCDFQTYAWNKHSSPEELLECFVGWEDYCEITQDLYNKLNN